MIESMRAQGLMPYRCPHSKNGFLTEPHVVIIGAGASKAACNVDKNGKFIPLLKEIHNHIDMSNIPEEIREIFSYSQDFEETYSELVAVKTDKRILGLIEQSVFEYFSSLRLPDELNLYDYLLLSLTSKDMIIDFNWDPFLMQAYRRNIEVGNLPQVCFPHGNTAIGICPTCKIKWYYGYRCMKCHEILKPLKLLYPITKKNYASIEIQDEWERARTALESAIAITIFGYSAPTSDKKAKNLMLKYFAKSHIEEIAPFTIIDIKSKNQLKMTWHEFYEEERQRELHIVKKFKDSILYCSPRVSCEAHYDTILQGQPWHNVKSFRNFKTLEDLQAFVKTINDFKTHLP